MIGKFPSGGIVYMLVLLVLFLPFSFLHLDLFLFFHLLFLFLLFLFPFFCFSCLNRIFFPLQPWVVQWCTLVENGGHTVVAEKRINLSPFHTAHYLPLKGSKYI